MDFQTAFDSFARLLPGGLIIVAAIVAYKQLAAARRATAMTIAKAHYREFLEQCLFNSDVAFCGATPEALAAIRTDPESYKRYRWLVTQALFALQEMYLAYSDDSHWRSAVITLASAFKYSILSDAEIPQRMRNGWNPDFMRFLESELTAFIHPSVTAKPELFSSPELIAPIATPSA